VVVLAHYGGADEITYVFLPALIFFVVYRLVRGHPEPPEEQDPQAEPDPDRRPAGPTDRR
jgi:hypothetical protein